MYTSLIKVKEVNGKELWNLISKINPNESLSEELGFLMEELGDISKGVMYGIILAGNPEVPIAGYKTELKKAFGDLITQLKILIHRTGYTWYECEYCGEEALKERVERLLNKNWNRSK